MYFYYYFRSTAENLDDLSEFSNQAIELKISKPYLIRAFGIETKDYSAVFFFFFSWGGGLMRVSLIQV